MYSSIRYIGSMFLLISLLSCSSSVRYSSNDSKDIGNDKLYGIASYYGDKFVGRKTSSGEIYNHDALTAAHKSIKFGTMVKVTNIGNNKSVIVRINDRGPYVDGRIIDLSKSAAEKIGMLKSGTAKVEIEIIK